MGFGLNFYYIYLILIYQGILNPKQFYDNVFSVTKMNDISNLENESNVNTISSEPHSSACPMRTLRAAASTFHPSSPQGNE